jgi:hypothetical protein
MLEEIHVVAAYIFRVAHTLVTLCDQLVPAVRTVLVICNGGHDPSQKQGRQGSGQPSQTASPFRWIDHI